MPLSDHPVVKNHLWPAIMGAASAAITAVASGLGPALLDGVDGKDLITLGCTAGAAFLGYLATIMQRHAGEKEPWTQPPQ